MTIDKQVEEMMNRPESEIPEEERWLYKDKESLKAVLTGLDQAKKGQFAKNPPVIDMTVLEDE